MGTKKDPTTQSNYQDISTKHIDFSWDVDFNLKIISGTVKLHLVAHRDNVAEVV